MKLFAIVRKALCAVGILSLLSSCTARTGNEKVFIDDMAAAYQKLGTGGDTLNISAVTRFAWDKLFIFPPYTPIEVMDRALGVTAPSALKDTRIFERDDINVFVFLVNDEITAVISLPREVVDVSLPKSDESLSHQTAVFSKTDKPKTLILVNPG
jgi:hypothetical protein